MGARLRSQIAMRRNHSLPRTINLWLQPVSGNLGKGPFFADPRASWSASGLSGLRGGHLWPYAASRPRMTSPPPPPHPPPIGPHALRLTIRIRLPALSNPSACTLGVFCGVSVVFPVRKLAPTSTCCCASALRRHNARAGTGRVRGEDGVGRRQKQRRSTGGRGWGQAGARGLGAGGVSPSFAAHSFKCRVCRVCVRGLGR